MTDENDVIKLQSHASESLYKGSFSTVTPTSSVGFPTSLAHRRSSWGAAKAERRGGEIAADVNEIAGNEKKHERKRGRRHTQFQRHATLASALHCNICL